MPWSKEGWANKIKNTPSISHVEVIPLDVELEHVQCNIFQDHTLWCWQSHNFAGLQFLSFCLGWSWRPICNSVNATTSHNICYCYFQPLWTMRLQLIWLASRLIVLLCSACFAERIQVMTPKLPLLPILTWFQTWSGTPQAYWIFLDVTGIPNMRSQRRTHKQPLFFTSKL